MSIATVYIGRLNFVQLIRCCGDDFVCRASSSIVYSLSSRTLYCCLVSVDLCVRTAVQCAKCVYGPAWNFTLSVTRWRISHQKFSLQGATPTTTSSSLVWYNKYVKHIAIVQTKQLFSPLGTFLGERISWNKSYSQQWVARYSGFL